MDKPALLVATCCVLASMLLGWVLAQQRAANVEHSVCLTLPTVAMCVRGPTQEAADAAMKEWIDALK